MTRMQAVRLAIEELEKRRRIYSTNRLGLLPAEGAEAEFYQYDDAIREIKELCNALQTESVRRSLAAWQEDIIQDQERMQKMAMMDLAPAEGEECG